MTCRTFQLPGGGTVIACTRERKRRCYTCQAPNASLSCDGCDHVLCTGCAVSPKQGLDYCPKCFAAAFDFWKGICVYPQSRPERRQAFRLWAREHHEKFLELARPRTKASVREVAT
jgi:hypothetical protein